MDFGLCQKIANYIMRPPRTTYQLQDLGPKIFHHRNCIYQRIDFQVQNQRNLKLQCSIFKEKHKIEKRQTVIFLHANSSSRLAVKNYLSDLLPFFNVACMDCAGSGISEGNFVTLGYYEKEDVRSLISFLKTQFELSKFILWGRSMGAVTSLLYAAKYQNVQAVVSDNAFSDLEEACKQLKDKHQEHIDENMNKTQKLSFKLKELKPKLSVSKIVCPIFYVYSENDKIVNNRHSKILYERSKYPKRIMSVKGDHNGARDADIKGKVIDYLLEIILNNKKSKENKVQHKYSDLETREEESMVYQSPFNQHLRQSYLGSSKKKRVTTQFSEEQNIQRRFSFKLNRKTNDYPVSQTFVSYQTSQIGSGILDSESKQDQYKIETNQFFRAKTSCFDSCQPTRRRKKIFSNS